MTITRSAAHSLERTKRPSWHHCPLQCVHAGRDKCLIDRGTFVLDLLRVVATVPNIALHCGASLDTVNFANHTANLTCQSRAAALEDDSAAFLLATGSIGAEAQQAADTPLQPSFNLLIGADGCASKVNETIQLADVSAWALRMCARMQLMTAVLQGPYVLAWCE